MSGTVLTNDAAAILGTVVQALDEARETLPPEQYAEVLRLVRVLVVFPDNDESAPTQP